MEHLRRDPKRTNWVKKRAGFSEEAGTEGVSQEIQEKTESESEKKEKTQEKK